MFGLFKRKGGKASRTRFTRSFSAAEVSRILAPWQWDGGFSNQEIAVNLSVIRARSRDMQKNNEHYGRWLDLFVSNVVGDVGFTLIPKPAAVEGDPTKIDKPAAAFLKYHFWRWASNKKWTDVTGRKTFPAICRLLAENWARDGEGIAMLDTHAQNPYGISLRVIRPDALDEMANGKTSSGTVIRNGVEVDERTLRPVYYCFRADKEDTTAVTIGLDGRKIQKVSADEILHVFTQHDECQTRGVPLGHASLKKLKMLDEYNVAELVAARDESNTMGIFHAPVGQGGEIGEYDDEELRAMTMPSEAGTKLVLENGWDYKTVTPSHPNRELTNFKNSMLRDIASGLGVEYACFANDFSGVSYSSIRAGTLAERDHWRTLQSQMIEQFVTPVFQAWLASFLRLAASKDYSIADYDRLSEHEFRGRRWEWVDPLKDVNASVIAVEHNWKTDEQIAADYGCDIDDNIEDNSRTRSKAEDMGVLPKPTQTGGGEDGSGEDDAKKD